MLVVPIVTEYCVPAIRSDVTCPELALTTVAKPLPLFKPEALAPTPAGSGNCVKLESETASLTLSPATPNEKAPKSPIIPSENAPFEPLPCP